MMGNWYVPPPISRKQQRLASLNLVSGVIALPAGALLLIMTFMGLPSITCLLMSLSLILIGITALVNARRMKKVPLPRLSYDPKLYPKDIWRVWLAQQEAAARYQQACVQPGYQWPAPAQPGAQLWYQPAAPPAQGAGPALDAPPVSQPYPPPVQGAPPAMNTPLSSQPSFPQYVQPPVSPQAPRQQWPR